MGNKMPAILIMNHVRLRYIAIMSRTTIFSSAYAGRIKGVNH